MMIPSGLLKEYSRGLSMLVRGLDILAVFSAGWIAYGFRFGWIHLTSHYLVALGVGALLTAVLFSWFGIYQSTRTQGLWRTLGSLMQAMSAVYLVLAGLAFMTKTGESFSRGWFLAWFIIATIGLMVARGSFILVLRFMRAHGMNERKVIIIGAGRLTEQLVETMHHALWTGFRIITIFDNTMVSQKKISGISVDRLPDDLEDYLRSHPLSIDEVWLALPLGEEACIKRVVYQLRHHTIAVRFVLDILGLELRVQSFTDLAGFPAINLNTSPMVGVNRIIKAAEDKMLAAIIVLLISPLLMLIAIAIKLTSKGPILFKQLRHGWDGKVIKVYKFRTMVVHAEDGSVTQATVNDHRVTRLGRFLRRTSLDELPQFFNVLQGRMSIVGPRPHAIEHNEFYKDSIKAYMQRHRVKPGITGLAQIKGWRGQTDVLHKMQKRVEYDLYYIENWSLLLDLKIIMVTIFFGFINRNAY